MAAVDDDEERWLKHYSSNHQILLVGDGDVSFSLSLAFAFHSASNIVATSLDAQNTVVTKYANAKSNLKALEMMGATILHGVDATKMKLHIDLKMRKFDWIIYNFPHAGFKGKEDQSQLIELHRQLVYGFFRNAHHLLRPFGEVHVTHKTESPYNKWNLKELASQNSLMLIERAAFNIDDYPGYNNKRGDGVNCDQPFRLGECCTYKFAIGDIHGKKAISHMNAANLTSEDGSWNATVINHSFDIQHPQADFMPEMAVRTQNIFVEPFDAEHIPSTGFKATSGWIISVSQTTFDTPVGGTQQKIYSPPRYGISNLSSRALGNHVVGLRDTVRRFGPDLRLSERFMPGVYEPRMGVRGRSDHIRDIIARYGPDIRNDHEHYVS